jgi:drug/metabolite transporter (DMT)-like permease
MVSVFGIPRARILPVLLLGLFGFAPQAGLFFLTVKILDPGITGLLLYLYPSFVVLFSFLFLKKKPAKIQILALALSLSGCALTFFRAGRYPAAGLALGAFVALAYAAYLVAGERILAGLDPFGATALIMMVAAAVYWIFVLFSGIPPRAPGNIVSILGFLGVFLLSTVLPITTLFMAMQRIGAADTSLVSTVEPVFTLIMSALIIGERLGLPQLAGGALILCAVILLRFAPSPGNN